MIFYAVWDTSRGNQAHGYVRAGNRSHAEHILRRATGCSATEIAKAYGDMITPKSVTVNFTNTARNALFR